MIKTGRRKIQKNRNVGKPAKCANCGGEGSYMVTYEDMYSKFTVTLCEECDKLQYEQLKLQATLPWTGSA
jgi:excinuclease UvrABC ATPase subunit